MKAATQLRSGARLFVIGIFAAFGGCAPLAQVREVDPKFRPQLATTPRLHQTETAIVAGQKLQRSAPDRAAGFYLSAVEAATRDLAVHPGDALATTDYNFALCRVFTILRQTERDPWSRPWRIPSPDKGEYILTYHAHPNALWKPQEFDLIPADELRLGGRFIQRRVTRDGIGAPLVAIAKPNASVIRHPFVAPHIYASATAVAHFSGHICEIEFVEPLATDTARVSGKTMPCAADFTAPIAIGLAREHPEKIAVPAMLDAERFANETRLVRIQPYDPKKIPVLFVHGLQSTPVTWVPMINGLAADQIVRRNYQAWVFSYPSGYPVPYSAMLLRRQLDAVDKAFPNHRPIILVGHSMGGILSRLMITDSEGDKVWRYLFGRPPSQTSLSPATKALLEEGLIFKPRPGIARVIFISTPHHGSVIAQDAIGRLASSMIHRSVKFAGIGSEAMKAAVVQQQDPGLLKLNRMPNSIDTLSPNDAWVRIMNTLPMKPGIPYHSIMGDRGRGDTPDSSDGVVPYWSSHLDRAASEKIVPSNHAANQNPQAITEVASILEGHVGKRAARDVRTESAGSQQNIGSGEARLGRIHRSSQR